MGKHSEGFAQRSGRSATNKELTIAVGEHRDYQNKRKNRNCHKRAEFLATVKIECILWRGNAVFGTKKSMTCREMGALNTKFAIQYGAALDKNPDALMWKWKIVDRKQFNIDKTKFIQG